MGRAARQRFGAAWRRAPAWLALGVALTGAADGVAPAAPVEHRFAQVPCSQIDLRCPLHPPPPALAMLPSEPAAGVDLAALAQTRAPEPGWTVASAGGSWLLAVGPLQAAGIQPTLRGWRLQDHVLLAEVDYAPHDAAAMVARRYVPAYGVLLLAIPPLPPGCWQVEVRWHATGAAGAPASVFSAGPMAICAY